MEKSAARRREESGGGREEDGKMGVGGEGRGGEDAGGTGGGRLMGPAGRLRPARSWAEVLTLSFISYSILFF